MAKRKASRKKKNPDILGTLSATLTRAEVVGSVLILVAVFTLLSLITGSQGAITGAWVTWLERAFGIGVWGVPLVTGALGMWMVIRAIDRMPNQPWQRPVGAGFLFLGFVIGATLLTGVEGAQTGGAVGAFFSFILRDAVGAVGAWAFVLLLVVAGMVLLTDRWLVDVTLELWDRLDDLRYSGQAGDFGPSFSPANPPPSGEIPWWKRQMEKISGIRLAMPALPGRKEPEPPVISAGRSTEPRPSAAPAPAQREAPARSAPPATPAMEGEILTPRIVGGAQEWVLPRPGDMLSNWERFADSDERIRQQGRLIQETLALFGVPADFEGAYKGPAVTQYLIKPGYVERTIRGEVKRIKVKVSKIAALSNDLALALAAPSVRIEAPIPGTTYVGVEVPNQESNVVGLLELMESETYAEHKGKLRIALGEDVKGQAIIADLARMPHLLIAGATGSGKSVCINSIITCLLLTNTPDDLRMLMVDPKMVELSVYNGVPHLLSPVVTEVDKASGVLFWAVKEMERRYQLFSKANARDIERYNNYLVKRGEKKLPYIVVIVDEMADLMMAQPEDVERHICRLAQMARAVGIHLIIATQRPSVDVITGLIKANFPARIAFAVTSQTDSRVILDIPGADRLLGKGDMLFMAPDSSKLERIQGTWLSDEEISRSVRYWKGIRSYDDSGAHRGMGNPPPTDDETEEDEPPSRARSSSLPVERPQPSLDVKQAPLFDQIETMRAVEERDELFEDAVEVVRKAGRGSVSLLQRKLRVGYSRASRLVDQLEAAGVLGPDEGGNNGRNYLGAGYAEPQDDEQAGYPPPRIIGGESGDSQEDDAPRIWF